MRVTHERRSASRSARVWRPAAHNHAAGDRRRLWAERIGIGLFVAAALMAPLLVGLAYYLVLSDGLTLNGDDPLREARLWIIQERRGFTGLALSVAAPVDTVRRRGPVRPHAGHFSQVGRGHPPGAAGDVLPVLCA